MARDSHANHFGDATPHHVPYRGAAQIVKEQTSATRGFCYRVPGTAKVRYALPVARETGASGLLPATQAPKSHCRRFDRLVESKLRRLRLPALWRGRSPRLQSRPRLCLSHWGWPHWRCSGESGTSPSTVAPAKDQKTPNTPRPKAAMSC